MKFRLFIRVIIPIAVIIAVFLMFFNITRVDVFESSYAFRKKDKTPILSCTSIKSIFTFNKAMLTSQKMSGKVNVVGTHYVLDVYHIGNKKETIHLWINSKSTKAIYEKEGKSSTSYTLSKKSTKQLKEIILKNSN